VYRKFWEFAVIPSSQDNFFFFYFKMNSHVWSRYQVILSTGSNARGPLAVLRYFLYMPWERHFVGCD